MSAAICRCGNLKDDGATRCSECVENQSISTSPWSYDQLREIAGASPADAYDEDGYGDDEEQYYGQCPNCGSTMIDVAVEFDDTFISPLFRDVGEWCSDCEIFHVEVPDAVCNEHGGAWSLHVARCSDCGRDRAADTQQDVR